MKKYSVLMLSLISCVSLAIQAYAQYQLPQSSAALPMPSATPIYDVANVMYVTFKMLCPNYQANNPQACSTSSSQYFMQCPQGLILVPNSGTFVPPIPGSDPNLQLNQAYYYWQCMQNVSGYNPVPTYNPGTAGNPQPFVNMSYPINSYAGTVPGVSNPAYGSGGIYAANTNLDWMNYAPDASGNTSFTYFQFPNNSFIPTGLGGSGLACGTTTSPQPAPAGDQDTIECVDSFGRPITNMDYSSPYWNIPYHFPQLAFVFYISPNTNATCHVVRHFGSTGDLAGGPDCNASIQIPAGQAAVMACCDGTWSCSITNWDSPYLTTCYWGCQNMTSCPGQINYH